MPRIDPAQLLNCLQVLLSPTGGILSGEEVPRLASLMTKFSKKLVSKCVYVLILKNTEKLLLNNFMGCGGWSLIQLWLHDAMYSSNWDLVKEILELLLLTPVDVERLKSNNIPKLVKSLSKRDDIEGVAKLASQLVQLWLKIVKDETQSEQMRYAQASATSAGDKNENVSDGATEETDSKLEDVRSISTKDFYKLSLKENRAAKSATVVEGVGESSDSANQLEESDKDKASKRKSHEKSHSRSSSSSKSSKSSHKDKHSSSSSSKDKDKHKDSRSKDRSKDRNKDRSKDRSKEKDKHSSSRDKDKHRSNGSVSSTSSSSNKSSKTTSSSSSSKDKDKKDNKQTEKDQDTLNLLQPQSIHKLPKIPKKSSDDKNKEAKDAQKVGSISIETRKAAEERPKTVKVYQSKMRSTGLEEEAKPAPPRTTKKPSTPPVIPPAPAQPVVPPKRTSPIRDISEIPPEKKLKVDVPIERPGSIKLIPPKPKPAVLQESDMFMDALTAATTKKEPKKRKRRASASKDTGSPPTSPTPLAPTTSPIGIKNIVPPKFYQDTLQTEDPKPHTEDAAENTTEKDSDLLPEVTEAPAEDPAKSVSDAPVNPSGLKSVLVYVRRKGPKKSIKWKTDDELVDVRYFELDESERVNVTRAFGDLAKMDVSREREALQLSRKLSNEDVMDTQTVWKVPTEIDLPQPLIVMGCKSFERDIQFAREKTTLQALYFNKRMVPDSPAEPDLENYQVKDPIPIPVEDAENPDHDFRNTPWPEPKGSPPRPTLQNNPPLLFHNINQPVPVPAPQNFPNIQQSVQNNLSQLQFNAPQPHFVPPQNIQVPDWNARNMQPNMLIPPNMQAPELSQMSGINPMFLQAPEQFNPMNEMNHRFPPPFNQQGPPMFPQNNFNHHSNRGGPGRGRGNNQFGGFRRGGGGDRGGGNGGGSWMRMNGPSQLKWHKNQRGHNRRGGGGGGGNFDNRGYTGNAELY